MLFLFILIEIKLNYFYLQHYLHKIFINHYTLTINASQLQISHRPLILLDKVLLSLLHNIY